MASLLCWPSRRPASAAKSRRISKHEETSAFLPVHYFAQQPRPPIPATIAPNALMLKPRGIDDSVLQAVASPLSRRLPRYSKLKSWAADGVAIGSFKSTERFHLDGVRLQAVSEGLEDSRDNLGISPITAHLQGGSLQEMRINGIEKQKKSTTSVNSDICF